eukprot:scaffold8876_cov108-Skeletonema_marinoi.AAC.3
MLSVAAAEDGAWLRHVHDVVSSVYVELRGVRWRQAQLSNGEQTAFTRTWRIIWKRVDQKTNHYLRVVQQSTCSPGQRTQTQNKLWYFVIHIGPKHFGPTPEINSYLPSSHSFFYSRKGLHWQ